MCRNIRTLYNFDPPATEDEIRASALQFVRKVSGFTKPSQANEVAFHRAVDRVAEAAAELLAGLTTRADPRNREVEAAKAKARAGEAVRLMSSAAGTRTALPPYPPTSTGIPIIGQMSHTNSPSTASRSRLAGIPAVKNSRVVNCLLP